ncbi:unnamed protein product [Adineta steineri]|uniref:Uncharacterized protein n=1 Tax=Adineta steineri TaxID=433720 RepID=A0A814YKR8_9BILA|nr:unnamed protein product [Adineta steineri]
MLIHDLVIYCEVVQGEQFFKSSFRLSGQLSFGRSLFRPHLHVLHSHFIFEHKYNWTNYDQHVNRFYDELDDKEIFYPFDFCGQYKQSNEQHQNINDNPLRRSVPTDLYSLSRANSSRITYTKAVVWEFLFFDEINNKLCLDYPSIFNNMTFIYWQHWNTEILVQNSRCHLKGLITIFVLI